MNGELIVKSGLVDKRKVKAVRLKHSCTLDPSLFHHLQGLFSKRRQMILTDVPRLYYVDPLDMTLKGEIPW